MELDNYAKAITHVEEHACFMWRDSYGEHPLALIESGKGSRSACITELARNHYARAMHFWLAGNDIDRMKQEAYVSSKLRYINECEMGLDFPTESYFFTFLISDYHNLLKWLADRPALTIETIEDINNVTHHLFRHYQMTLAIRGDWSQLAERAERQLTTNPPGHKKFMVDQRFYLALARGDVPAMEIALAELTSPKMAKIRNDEIGFAFTHFFIGTHATMYAKIAWIHGFEVNINTSLIPQEWLPVKPLAEYMDPYPFMQNYLI